MLETPLATDSWARASLGRKNGPWPKQKLGAGCRGKTSAPWAKVRAKFLLWPRGIDLHKLGWRGVGDNFLPGRALAHESVAKEVPSIRGFIIIIIIIINAPRKRLPGRV